MRWRHSTPTRLATAVLFAAIVLATCLTNLTTATPKPGRRLAELRRQKVQNMIVKAIQEAPPAHLPLFDTLLEPIVEDIVKNGYKIPLRNIFAYFITRVAGLKRFYEPGGAIDILSPTTRSKLLDVLFDYVTKVTAKNVFQLRPEKNRKFAELAGGAQFDADEFAELEFAFAHAADRISANMHHRALERMDESAAMGTKTEVPGVSEEAIDSMERFLIFARSGFTTIFEAEQEFRRSRMKATAVAANAEYKKRLLEKFQKELAAANGKKSRVEIVAPIKEKTEKNSALAPDLKQAIEEAIIDFTLELDDDF